ncbi:unnamed protein product [Urochloa decumbens]|uniref:Uncharacterized protein n=1 Tax=Urochloa decumbens TaxID=240449 RepID=A0ABC9AQJ5_9POAL
MERNEKKKSKKPWVGPCILAVATASAVAVAAGAFFMLSRIGEGDQEQTEGRTMKGPDTGGERISRGKFEADPKNYFRTNRLKGPKAAVEAFK